MTRYNVAIPVFIEEDNGDCEGDEPQWIRVHISAESVEQATAVVQAGVMYALVRALNIAAAEQTPPVTVEW